MRLTRSIALFTIVAFLEAIAASDFHELLSRSSLQFLSTREDSCTKLCETARQSFNVCTSLTEVMQEECMCAAALAEELQSCVSCILSNYASFPAIDISAAVKTASAFNAVCSNISSAVPSITLPSIGSSITLQSQSSTTTAAFTTTPVTPSQTVNTSSMAVGSSTSTNSSVAVTSS